LLHCIQEKCNNAGSAKEARPIKGALRSVEFLQQLSLIRLVEAATRWHILESAAEPAVDSPTSSCAAEPTDDDNNNNSSSSSSGSAIPEPAELSAAAEQHISEIAQLLLADSWNLDVLVLAERFGELLLLPKVLLAIFDSQDMCSQLGYNRQQLWDNVCAVESLYSSSNSYHNALHAADVAVTVFGALQRDAAKVKATLAETAAVVYAAAVHHVLHTGEAS
jgi:hypothetical protein